MIELTEAQVNELISILKRLDVRGFESNDLLIGVVRFLNERLAAPRKEK